MKDRWLAILFGLAGGGVIRLGLSLWRGSDRVEALMITLVSFGLVGIGYLIFSRSGK